MIQALLLANNEIIIAQVYEVDVDPGKPNCRLIDPYLFKTGGVNNPGFRLIPWLQEVTEENNMMIHPDKIITVVDVKDDVLKLYKKIIFIDSETLDDEIEDDDEEEV